MIVYAVVQASGLIKWAKGRGLSIYSAKGVAQGQCKKDGDCVVEVEIDLSRRPIFIRKQKLNG